MSDIADKVMQSHETMDEEARKLCDAVDRFARLMKAKLLYKKQQGHEGWDEPKYLSQISVKLLEHAEAVVKDADWDQIDVANLAMMHHELKIEYLPVRVWQMNDVVEWVAARTMEEAILYYWELTSVTPDDEMGVHDVRPLTEEEMEDLTYTDVEDDYAKRSFDEQLDRMRDDPEVEFPVYFATTEY